MSTVPIRSVRRSLRDTSAGSLMFSPPPWCIKLSPSRKALSNAKEGCLMPLSGKA